MSWDRFLWGVEFTGSIKADKPILIGSSWMGTIPEHYDGEPSRPILFCTREKAREWCRSKMDEYKDGADVCAEWRFRVVRVRETVTAVKP